MYSTVCMLPRYHAGREKPLHITPKRTTLLDVCKYYPVLGVLWHHHYYYTLPQETAPPPRQGRISYIHTYMLETGRQAGRQARQQLPRFLPPPPRPRKQSKAGKLAECGVTLVTVLYCLKHADDFPVFLKESSLFGCKVIRVSE